MPLKEAWCQGFGFAPWTLRESHGDPSGPGRTLPVAQVFVNQMQGPWGRGSCVPWCDCWPCMSLSLLAVTGAAVRPQGPSTYPRLGALPES